MSDLKPREFWVSVHGSTWIDWDGPPKLAKDFYLGGGKTYHVIEYSAYEAVKKELDFRKAEISVYKEENEKLREELNEVYEAKTNFEGELFETQKALEAIQKKRSGK